MSVEKSLARQLRNILMRQPAGEIVVDFPESLELLSPLEAFVEEALLEVHAAWKYEGLDGILPERIRKTSNDQVEIVGLCILISDQTMTPICVRLRVAKETDEIDWFECCLGECGPDGLIRIPYKWEGRGRLAVADRVNDIEWVYNIGFGEQTARDEQ